MHPHLRAPQERKPRSLSVEPGTSRQTRRATIVIVLQTCHWLGYAVAEVTSPREEIGQEANRIVLVLVPGTTSQSMDDFLAERAELAAGVLSRHYFTFIMDLRR
ncbi:hypothetical protein WOLCODRAFT_29349 [Wolfiporia cocos MD-104 SS10]|uniref:Uncharacterized protein n=1 Tax=Wolfiporia cocos (strain MD-104) TaxID=742152 RepID=A0A2H3JQV3_WOLCO|nr:hypothetical protein WOLCODRAFT_29349 [Wolfiporia cocos MD-104 SS10]